MSKLNADIPSVELNYSDCKIKNNTQAPEVTTVIFTKEQLNNLPTANTP